MGFAGMLFKMGGTGFFQRREVKMRLPPALLLPKPRVRVRGHPQTEEALIRSELSQDLFYLLL